MSEATLEHLAKIVRHVDAACFLAAEQRERFEADAINWADLGYEGAEYFEALDGTTGYRVFVEECAPEASKLKEFINDYLVMYGFGIIEIITRW